MNRALRGAWTRRRVLLALGVLAGLVLAGARVATVLPGEEGGGLALVSPLLLIGLLALLPCAHELAMARRHEIDLARLRGLHGVRMLAPLTIEPLVALALGAAAGVGVAVTVLRWNGVRPGRDVTAETLAVETLVVASAVVVIGTLVVLVEIARVGTASLADRLADRGPGRIGVRAGTAGLVALFVASAVAVQRTVTLEGPPPGWLVSAGPALLGLVAGQLAVWILRAAGGVWLLRDRGTPAGFVTAPRMARLDDAADGVRLLVAGSVVACLAATATTSLSSWAEETSALRAGAAQRVEVEGGPLQALRLSREVDPDGEWLMAAEVTRVTGETPQVLLDTARYAQVMAEHLHDTRASGIGGTMDRLAPGPEDARVEISTGEVLRVALARDGEARGGEAPAVPLRWVITYVNDENYSEQISATVTPGGETRRPIPRCSRGCAVTSVEARGGPGTSYAVRVLDFGGVDLTRGQWAGTRGALEAGVAGATLTTDGSGRAAVSRRSAPVAVISALAGEQPDEEITLRNANGEPRPAHVVDTSAALPLVEGNGVLADLPRMLTVAAPSGVASEALILAREDTPQDVLDEVAGDAGAPFRDAADVGSVTVEAAGTESTRAYLLVGLLCLLTAVPVLLAGRGRTRAQRIRGGAALRLAGLSVAQIRSAGRVEGCLTAGTVALVALAGGALTVWALLGDLELVDPPPGAVPLEAGPALVPLTGSVLAAALLAGLGTWSVLRRAGATSRPFAVLQEDGRCST